MDSVHPIAPPVEPRLLTLRAIVALSDLINSDAHPEQRAGLESCRDGLRRLALPAGEIELEPCPPAERPFPTMAGDVTGWHFGDVHVRGSVLAAAGVCTAALARYEDTPDARELDEEVF